MKLYGHPVSLRYLRLVIAAAELDLPVERVELNIGKGENRTPAYLAKNPMGKIPTLEDDDGWTLWESFAALVYLGEKHPERGLYPTDVRERADALRWMFWCASHLDPAVVGLYVQRVIAPMRGQTPDEAVIATSTTDLARFLPVLETHLGGRTWMLGERFSLVDVALGASIAGLFHKRIGFDGGTCPNVATWHGRLVERPSWRLATGR